jgi:hypothetical protein
MQQLSLLDPLPAPDGVPVWHALDEEQRLSLVTKLARLMARTVTPTPGEQDNARTEQDHE